jgi:exportin-2 (importin alpha re-exporter)
MLPGLITPMLWERQGNIPALVRLLQAYLLKGGRQIVQANHLNSILGIFQKLIASKTHDHEGFFLLESIISALPP